MSSRLLSVALAFLVGLAFWVSQAAPADRVKGVLGECAAGSVPAVIELKHVCLKPGQRCNSTPAWQSTYRLYGFRCKRGRLSRLPGSTVYSAIEDVGGYRLRMYCRGRAAPTVVMESGFGVGGSVFYGVQQTLAKTVRLCFYDRAGLGLSDRRKPLGPVPAARVVEDLHALLMAAGIKPPYVLGGWSLGGFFIRLYTKHYPDEVLGVVTLDGTPFGLPPVPPPIPGADLLDNGAEAYYMADADAEVAASPSLGARPLIVLTHAVKDPPQDPLEATWLKAQKQVVRLSTSSILVSADISGHGIAMSQPNLTAEAFREVIAAVRAGRALPACAESKLLRFHATCLDPNRP